MSPATVKTPESSLFVRNEYKGAETQKFECARSAQPYQITIYKRTTNSRNWVSCLQKKKKKRRSFWIMYYKSVSKHRLAAIWALSNSSPHLQKQQGNHTRDGRWKPGSFPSKDFVSHQHHFSPSLQLLFQTCSLHSLHAGDSSQCYFTNLNTLIAKRIKAFQGIGPLS